MSEIVDLLKELVDFEFEVKKDPKLIRPTDEPIIYGSNIKLKNSTNWEQTIPLKKTLQDMLNYWREVL